MSSARVSGKKAPSSQYREQLISAGDIVFTLSLAPFMLLVWLMPAALRPRLARAVAAVTAAVKPNRAATEGPRLSAPFGPKDVRKFYLDVQTHFQLERLNLFALHGPFYNLPETRLVGAEYLRAALARGKGAIAWVMPTAHSRTEAKLALWREGFRVMHLSRVTHGFSTTRYGKRFLNPLRARIEARFLAGRAVIGEGGPRAALAELTRHLAANGVVSITMGWQANQVETLPFMSGVMTIATRPALLAQETGAALLPVIPIRREDGVFEVEVGAPLLEPGDPAGQPGCRLAVERLAEFLKPRVIAHTAQFGRAYVFHAPERNS